MYKQIIPELQLCPFIFIKINVKLFKKLIFFINSGSLNYQKTNRESSYGHFFLKNVYFLFTILILYKIT